MRFSAPRSYSPSPVRGKHRHSSTFGLQSDSDSEDYESELESSSQSGDNDDTVSIASSSSSEDSFALVSTMNKMAIRPPRRPEEQRFVEETVASIRLRSRYQDPYEEWEKETRRDALRTARKELAEVQNQQALGHEESLRREAQRQKEIHEKAFLEAQKQLGEHHAKCQEEERKLRQSLQAREQELWKRINDVIKLEEEKLAKQLEEAKKKREEEERVKREEELKRRLAEEKRRQEEDARKKEEEAKKKAEEDKKKQEEERLRKEKEDEEMQKRLDQEKKKKEAEEGELRGKLAVKPADDDWRTAREALRSLKTGPMATVKGNLTMKKAWMAEKRKIQPKIGQLTNDSQAIFQISKHICEVLRQPPNEMIGYASMASLAKSILLQAETEVTAEKRSAIPLAQVAFNLFETFDIFPSIFFSKLVQRCGGWAIPLVPPRHDIDGKQLTPEEYAKVCGRRKSESKEGTMETPLEYSNRISAMMRVYFHVLKIRPMAKPLETMFQLPRYWTWMARLLGDPRLLAEPVAAQLIYTALEVLGLEAKDVWGKQWMKILALIYEGITTGYDNGKLIGGDTAEGAASRSRIMLVLESIISGTQLTEGSVAVAPMRGTALFS